MSTGQLICIAAVVLFVAGMSSYAGWTIAIISAYVVTLGGITTTLYMAPSLPHYGIAPPSPALGLSDVLLLCAVVAIWARGGRLDAGWILAVFLLAGVVLILTVWGNTSEQWSGLKLYSAAILSLAVGRWLNENLTERGAVVLASACLLVCGLQFLAALAQSQGLIFVRLAGVEAAQWIREGRMVGLYSHPSMLGKTMLLLLCILLPLSVRKELVTRRLAYVAIALGSIATLLTVSRANSVAIFAAIILWVIFSGRTSSIAQRLGVVMVFGILIVLNTNAIAALEQRQADDPNGGSRDPILEVGLNQIQRAPLTGTGPNYYSEVVGQHDIFAATGFPLHNSFLYPAAELGIPLAVVFFLPLCSCIWLVASKILKTGTVDLYSGALLSVIPGVILVAWTGWGLIATEALPLWFLGFGFLSTSRNGRIASADMSQHSHQRLAKLDSL